MLKSIFCAVVAYIFYLKVGLDNQVFDRESSIYIWCFLILIMSCILFVRARLLCCVLRSKGYRYKVFFVIYDKFLSVYMVLFLLSLLVNLESAINPALIGCSLLISFVLASDGFFAYDFFWSIRVAEFADVETPANFSTQEMNKMIGTEVFLYVGFAASIWIFSVLFPVLRGF